MSENPRTHFRGDFQENPVNISILSLRGLPSEAKFGVQSIFYYILAAVVFLVPFSLVCAELASTYTRAGGLYRWVSEAFGPRWGWTAMYLEWQTIVIWFPTEQEVDDAETDAIAKHASAPHI